MLLIFTFPKITLAIIPFNVGGRVVVPFPCVNGIIFSAVQPTIPATIVLNLPTFVHAHTSFTPPTPAQQFVGKAWAIPYPCLIPCPIGVCPIAFSPVILFSGGSFLF